MTTIVTRAGKGTPLTFTEADANFTNLNTYKYESGDSPSFAAITNGGVLTTGFNAGTSYIIGMGAIPVQWDSTGTRYGYQLGTNAFLVNAGNTYTQLSHGMRVDSAGNQVYTVTGSVSPVWISLSGGTFYVYGAASGTAGNTISAVIPPFSVDCTTNTVTINNETVNSYHGVPFRNRCVNGNMVVNQRATVSTTTNGDYPVDRWILGFSGTGTITMAQTTTSPPEGFSNYIRVTATAADTAGAAEYYSLQHNIEGYDVEDFDLGKSTAIPFTLSFYVRSSLTGTFGGTIRNNAGTRDYPFTYTINAANSWERKTVTIAGDTSGTWEVDSDIGVRLSFDLGSGSNYLGTAGAWASSNLLGATGCTAVMATLNATWDITGIQLEAGSVATPFERTPHQTNLMRCMRYYQTNPPVFVKAVSATDYNGGNWGFVVPFHPQSPTIALVSGTNNFHDISVAFRNISTVTGGAFTAMGVEVSGTMAASTAGASAQIRPGAFSCTAAI